MALKRFDALAHAFAAAGTRRSLIGALGGGLLALAFPLSVGDPTALAATTGNRKRCPRARRCKQKCCRKGQTCQRGVCKKQPSNPPEPGVTRVRPDLHALAPDGPELTALERGIAEMKRRSNVNPNDPTGWEFQASLHQTNAATGNIHSSIHFLSWHRMYLYFFEQILRDAANEPTLALPYWDYSVPANRVIPGPFRDSASALYNPNRRGPVNDGAQPGSEDEFRFDDSAAMAVTNFTGAGTSFGGRTGARGLLEDSPHNHVHVWVGGDMGFVSSAPLDPLFWLHHANIDRLWEVWLRRGGGRANPTSGEFLTKQYTFYDKNGNQVRMSGSKILDTATQLNYTYAGQEPLRAAAMRGSGESSLGAAGAVKSTVLGSAKGGLKLASRPVDVEIPLRDGAGDELAAAGAAKRQTTLTFTGVTGGGVPGVTYLVHVNANSKSPKSKDASFVGAISLFGLQPDDHPGHHHSAEISFDITKRVGNGKRVEVTLVPSVLSDSGGRSSGTWATIEGVKITVEGAGNTEGNDRKRPSQNSSKPRPEDRQGKPDGPTDASKDRTKKQKPDAGKPGNDANNSDKDANKPDKDANKPGEDTNGRKRTVNRKPKKRTGPRPKRQQAAGATSPAIPGNKSSAVAGDGKSESGTDHAHH